MSGIQNHIAINVASAPPHDWVGVFDLDLTLGDFETISESIQYFFPESTDPTIFERDPEQQKYRGSLLRDYIYLLADREIALKGSSGCIVRPGIVPHLYRLLEHPGCNGMAIVSNNTNEALLHVVNYLLQAIGIRQRIKEAKNRPPFCTLVHHGDPIRSLEYEQQRKKNMKSLRTRRSGEVVLWNNTTKTLDTVHKLFLDKNKTIQCNRITNELRDAFQRTASLPYSLSSSTNSPALSPDSLVKSDRVFFADDNNTHQLIREVVDVGRQFVNCAPYESNAEQEDMNALFYKAWAIRGEFEGVKKWFAFLNENNIIEITYPTFFTELENKYITSIKTKSDAFLYESWEDPTLWESRIGDFFQFLEGRGAKGVPGVAKGGRRTVRRKSKASKKYLKSTRRRGRRSQRL